MNKVSWPKKWERSEKQPTEVALSIGKAGVSSKEQDKKKKTISKNQQ